MRFLFSFVGGRGHVDPLLPFARAARAAGHTVAFTGSASVATVVEGFPFLGLGPAAPRAPARIPLRVPSQEREDRVLRERFAGSLAAERAAELMPLCRSWKPDVIVCDETDFGAMVVAERLGIPHASVLVIATGAFVRPELVADPLNALRAQYGLPADPGLAMLSRYLVLAPFPPGFRDPARALFTTAHSVRPAVLDDPSAGAVVVWPDGVVGEPRIYLTLGTVFNIESGDLLIRLVSGLRELPGSLLVTVGPSIEPAELGPQPGNVRVAAHLPQAAVLATCDLVVSHAGSGTAIGALALGVPLLAVPMGADQLLNAARCDQLGVGRVMDAVTLTPPEVRHAAAALLADPDYRRAAARLAAQSRALPGPDHAVELLERLARDGEPIRA